MANPPSDLGIPILTEVIGPQARPEADSAADPARHAAPASAPAPASASLPPPTPAAPATQATATIAAARPAAATGAPSGLASITVSKPAAEAVQMSGRMQHSLASDAAGTPPAPAAATPAPAAPAAAAIPAAEAQPTAHADATADAPAAQAGNPWSEAECGELENELRLRITRQVLGRIDFVLDHRVRNTLTDVVDSAIDALAAEIKRGLHETLSDMVSRAVAQEIARLQSAKK